ncbi:MAG: hypothetical protein ACOYI2_09065 [Bacillota bacterium]
MKKLLILLFSLLFIFSASACTNPGQDLPENTPPVSEGTNDTQENKPSLAGISLGDPAEKAEEVFGKDFEETFHEEAGHFPESFYTWEYSEGTMVVIGHDSNKVLEIRSTSPERETNLGIKAGDQAEKVFNTYRGKYSEPESIHGGKLYGCFKVEEGQALAFAFNIENGYFNSEDIPADEQVEGILLTYPTYIDDSF